MASTFSNSATFSNGTLLLNPGYVSEAILMVQSTRLGILISITCLVWDWFTTIDLEVQHVWRARLSYAKVVFCVVRYLTPSLFLYQLFMLISPPSARACRITNILNSSLTSLIMVAVSSTLIARTWALYNRKRKVLIALLVAYVICFTPVMVFLARAPTDHIQDLINFNTLRHLVSNEPELTFLLGGCYTTVWDEGLVALFSALLVYETGIFAATAWKLWTVKSSSTLIGHLFQNGALYYVLILGTLMGGAIGSSDLATLSTRALVTSGYFVALKAIACSHMVLSIRGYLSFSEAYVDHRLRPLEGDDTALGVTNTSVHFAAIHAPGISDILGAFSAEEVDLEKIASSLPD